MAKHSDEPVDRAVSAVERTASILNAFLAERRSLSLGELEIATGLFKSVILRYMITLIRENLIRKLDNGDYQLGTKILSLANVYEQSIDHSTIIIGALAKLTDVTGETASFYVRRESTRVCLFRKNSPRSLLVNVRPGDTFPLDGTSTGQVLGEADAQPREDGDYLRQSIGQIDPLTTSISAPVFDAREKLVGALTLSGPIGRFEPSDPLVRDRLLTEVRSLSTALGSVTRYRAGTLQVGDGKADDAATAKRRPTRRAKAG